MMRRTGAPEVKDMVVCANWWSAPPSAHAMFGASEGSETNIHRLEKPVNVIKTRYRGRRILGMSISTPLTDAPAVALVWTMQGHDAAFVGIRYEQRVSVFPRTFMMLGSRF